MSYGNQKFRGGPQAPPVSEGDEIDVKIEAIGGKGDGIAKIKGFVLFVAGVKEGETCKVKITKVLQKVGFAEKIGAATSEPKTDSRPEAMPEPEPEPNPQDSDDFGADLGDEE